MPSDWPADVQQRLKEFARARDWERYHTPRNLAALISSEAGELLALFRWDQDALAESREKVEDELADVLLGVLRFADVAGIDLHRAASRKLEKNAARYPEGAPGPDRGAGDVVCGIDSGTFSSNSYVAWLRGREFRLDRYRPTPAAPLPETPEGWSPARIIALDLPQGLPRQGARRREADARASTPTNALPDSRAALATWRLYKGFVEAGVETYWTIHSTAAGAIAGLEAAAADRPLVVETYPRYVLKRLWPQFRIPSKRKEPESYTESVWKLLRDQGYTANAEPTRPDHVDAMLCALAARACVDSDELPAGTVGAPPYVDSAEKLIREGYIVAP
jgi:NTP pyrophosphatase (non-canonical NTP hydrolase)/predicted nuclease with RNAse H fold